MTRKTPPQPLTTAQIIAVAPKDMKWIPLNQDGTQIYGRDIGGAGFASPTPAGRRKFRRIYRSLAAKARRAQGSAPKP